eukprot:7325170-Pyramimonas_sp.AAC.2
MGKRGGHNAKPPQKAPCGAASVVVLKMPLPLLPPSAASALARLAAPDSFQRGTCDATDVNMAVKDATVPTCTTCFDLYCKGFTQFGSLEKAQEG